MMKSKEVDLLVNKHLIHVYIDGSLNKDSKVVVAVNGGPGSSGLSLVHFKELTKYGYTLIRYDQLGCGRSEKVKKRYDLYTVSHYVNELYELINQLKINQFVLLGHSWGGMLALEYMIRKKDKRVNKLILFSSLSSSRIWSESNLKIALNVLKDKEEKDLLIKAFKNNDYSSKKVLYLVNKKIWDKYYKHRESTSPYKRIKFRVNREIYNYMWGRAELFGSGTLKNWDVTNRLKELKVKTLIIHGKFDQSTKEVNQAMLNNIKNSKELYLDKSGHCGYINEFDKSMKNILNFIKS